MKMEVAFEKPGENIRSTVEKMTINVSIIQADRLYLVLDERAIMQYTMVNIIN